MSDIASASTTPVHPELPPTLLILIGRLATDWAVVEQEILLHTSAMAATDTGGVPSDHLRMDFKRLREKWFRLAKQKLPDSFQRDIELLNDRLARRSKARGYALHGIWLNLGDCKFRVHWWEQKDHLHRYVIETDLDDVIEQANLLRSLRFDLVAFMRGAHGEKD